MKELGSPPTLLKHAFDWNNFEYDDVTYHYQLAVNNTMVYLKDNISEKTKGSFEGLIRIDDSCYPCEVEAKMNNNHTYTTFRYRINSYLYTLSHETQNQKTSINYEVRIDEEVALTESVGLKFNNNTFEASFSNKNLLTEVERERSFTHKTGENTVRVDYVKKSESKNVHYENIKLTTSTGKSLSRTYSYEGVEDIVI